MSEKTKVHLRIVAFHMFCNHVPTAIIAKKLGLAEATLRRWQSESDFEGRRAALLESEIIPSWAQELRQLLLSQYARVLRMEVKMEAFDRLLLTLAEPEKPTMAGEDAGMSVADDPSPT